GVGEEGLHLVASRIIEQSKKLGPPFERHPLEHVGRVIRRQQSQPASALALGQAEEKGGLSQGSTAQEEGLGGRPHDVAEAFARLLRVEDRPELEELLRREILLRRGGESFEFLRRPVHALRLPNGRSKTMRVPCPWDAPSQRIVPPCSSTISLHR